MWILRETAGAGTADSGALVEARLAEPPVPLGERLLSGGFRASCQAMRAAAQFCGLTGGDEAQRGRDTRRQWAELDLQAWLLSGSLPLSEIAAAYRERK